MGPEPRGRSGPKGHRASLASGVHKFKIYVFPKERCQAVEQERASMGEKASERLYYHDY